MLDCALALGGKVHLVLLILATSFQCKTQSDNNGHARLFENLIVGGLMGLMHLTFISSLPPTLHPFLGQAYAFVCNGT